MSILATILVFAGIPVAVVLVIFGLVYGASGRRTSKRYRPGRPFTFAPVWFLASSREATAVARVTEAQLHPVTAGGVKPALPAAAGPTGQTDGQTGRQATHGETGGASDHW